MPVGLYVSDVSKCFVVGVPFHSVGVRNFNWNSILEISKKEKNENTEKKKHTTCIYLALVQVEYTILIVGVQAHAYLKMQNKYTMLLLHVYSLLTLFADEVQCTCALATIMMNQMIQSFLQLSGSSLYFTAFACAQHFFDGNSFLVGYEFIRTHCVLCISFFSFFLTLQLH